MGHCKMGEQDSAAVDQDPLDRLCMHLYSLAESQRETNTLLGHLMQKPISQNFLSNLSNISYLRGSHAILISSQNTQNKKLWCSTCKKKSLVNLASQQHTAQSQCGHLQYCRDCSIDIHRKLTRCPHCVPLLHQPQLTTQSNRQNNQNINVAEVKKEKPEDIATEIQFCPVCSSELVPEFKNSEREQTVFNQLLSNYYVIVDTQDPAQCIHLYSGSGTKRTRDWDSSESHPRKLTRLNELHKNIIPTVKEGVRGMGKIAMEVGSNFLTRLSELDETDEAPFFDGMS